MRTQLITPEQFQKAEQLYKAINRECDARIWNKDGQKETVYRTLKAGVRAWSSAQNFEVIDREGFLLIDPGMVDTARKHQEWKKTDFDAARRSYLNDTEYRVQVNLGSQALAVEGLRDLSAAQAIYDTYQGQVGPPVPSTGPTYTEQVLAGTYQE